MGPLLGIGKAECYALEVIRGHVALS
jgi:hypothetical protein